MYAPCHCWISSGKFEEQDKEFKVLTWPSNFPSLKRIALVLDVEVKSNPWGPTSQAGSTYKICCLCQGVLRMPTKNLKTTCLEKYNETCLKDNHMWILNISSPGVHQKTVISSAFPTVSPLSCNLNEFIDFTCGWCWIFRACQKKKKWHVHAH